jgi:DNA repair exonuclease SbcCD ATPase subunit
MKTMTKAGLREFIETKVKAQREAVKETIKAIIDVKVTPIIDQMTFGYDGIEKRADKLAQELDALKDRFWTADCWDIRRCVQNLNSDVVDFMSKFKSSTLKQFYACELHEHGGHFNFENDELQAALESIFTETHDLHKKLDQLKQAQREILQAIGNASTAKNAHRDVIALGIDLRDYEEVAKLPAVVKLSVDPCLINGDCK